TPFLKQDIRDVSTPPIYSAVHSSPALLPAHAARKRNPCTVRRLCDTDSLFVLPHRPERSSLSDPEPQGIRWAHIPGLSPPCVSHPWRSRYRRSLPPAAFRRTFRS